MDFNSRILIEKQHKIGSNDHHQLIELITEKLGPLSEDIKFSAENGYYTQKFSISRRNRLDLPY